MPAWTPGQLKTRGVVLSVEDLLTLDWPKLAFDAGLTTIGTHVTPSQVARFITSEKGQQFLSDCKKYHIQVEHELHSMHDLLPRSLFSKNPDMFRMNDQGIRVGDYNCCAHSKSALDLIVENALKYADVLRATTGRYFYWIDDGEPMCRCEQCRPFSDSEQALIIENAVVSGLRKKYPDASLAHLAYANTIIPPVKVKPAEGIFLEFAPIYRDWAKPLTDRSAGGIGKIAGKNRFISHGETLDLLSANLEVFPKGTVQVLEYWLDDSLQSKWKKPPVKLSWYPEVCRSDVQTYEKMGVTNITSFAVYIDATYKKMYGDLGFIRSYGQILSGKAG
ncbi:DUF4838 domain-containing protein [Compostibacter hankyongensis]